MVARFDPSCGTFAFDNQGLSVTQKPVQAPHLVGMAVVSGPERERMAGRHGPPFYKAGYSLRHPSGCAGYLMPPAARS
jgi:hypothetical protein